MKKKTKMSEQEKRDLTKEEIEQANKILLNEKQLRKNKIYLVNKAIKIKQILLEAQNEAHNALFNIKK